MMKTQSRLGGMITADKCLYLTLKNGKLTCYSQ